MDSKETKHELKGLDDDEEDDMGTASAATGDALGDDDSVKLPSDALTIAGALRALAGRDLFSDVDFVVGKGVEQRTIPGHRLVLAAASDIFEAMLFPAKREQDGKEAKEAPLPVAASGPRLTVEIADVKPHIFTTMLQAIYSDSCDIKPEDLPDLIACANKFQLDGLRQLCISFMEEGVTAENACKLFETAPELLQDSHFALAFIEENAQEVIKSAGFDNLPRERLKVLLSSDALSANEIDIFRAVLRWSLCECKRQNLLDVPENRRAVLGDILPLIRFPTMTMEEVATYVSPSGVLSSEQLLEIFTYIGALKGNRPLPSISFPTRSRPGALEKWTLDPELKWSTVTLTEGNMVARSSGGGYCWCQGTVAWTRGRHAWRVTRRTGHGAWLLVGVSRKESHPQSSFQTSNVWGFNSSGQQYSAGSATYAGQNFNRSQIDCLLDASAGTFTIINLDNGTRSEMHIPRGTELVPHFSMSNQTIQVDPIPQREFGNKNYVLKRAAT